MLIEERLSLLQNAVMLLLDHIVYAEPLSDEDRRLLFLIGADMHRDNPILFPLAHEQGATDEAPEPTLTEAKKAYDLAMLAGGTEHTDEEETIHGND